MWLMLQHKIADDYVVATGETHSVREFVEAAFAVVDLPWKKYVKHDESFDRPTEPTRLVGCRQLVDETVEAELPAIDSGVTTRSEL
jgi:GDP-D-mannose dehydratase